MAERVATGSESISTQFNVISGVFPNGDTPFLLPVFYPIWLHSTMQFLTLTGKEQTSL